MVTKATFGGARKGEMVRARGIKDARYLSRGIMNVCKLIGITKGDEKLSSWEISFDNLSEFKKVASE